MAESSCEEGRPGGEISAKGVAVGEVKARATARPPQTPVRTLGVVVSLPAVVEAGVDSVTKWQYAKNCALGSSAQVELWEGLGRE